MKDLDAINNEAVNEIETTVETTLSVENKENEEQVEETNQEENPAEAELEIAENPVMETEIVDAAKDQDAASEIVEPEQVENLAEEVPTEVKAEVIEVAPVEEVVEEPLSTEVVQETQVETPQSETAEIVVEAEDVDIDAKADETTEVSDSSSEPEKEEIVSETPMESENQIGTAVEEEVVAAMEIEPEKVEPEVVVSETKGVQEEKPVTGAKEEKAKAVAVANDDEDDDIDENDIDNYLEHDDDDKEEVDQRIDYSVFSKEELVNLLADKLENAPVQDIKYDVDSIKSNFYKKHKADVDLAKKTFMTEGGDPALFVFEADPLEEKLKDQLNEYKRLKAEFNRELELEKESNLKKKYDIIEEIKELINGQESINKTFNDFRELQKRWRDIGLVPQAEVRNLWENYHHNIEQFYDYIKINRELRDLDLKKNLEQKIKLCEQSEELMMEPSVVKAFKQLQKLHDQWRDIGPVPEEQREDVWERFKSSTTYINKAHQDYFDNLKQEQTNNLNAKLALCEKAEELAALETDKHKDWEQYSDELIEVQKLWKTIGFATKKENNKIFERFRAACDLFFSKKRDFYFEHKEVQNNNYQMKIELCMQAESLKDSTDWKKTSNELIKLQKDWKEIGPVPRKLSDVIWKRFRAACNEFFARKEKYFSNIDQEFDGNLKAKEELIAKVKNFVQHDSIEENISQLKGFQNEWTEIGHVAYRLKDKIQKEFRDAVNEQFDKLKIDNDKRSVLVYKQRLENISQGTKPNHQYRVEKDRIIETIRHLESDIILLENNIGFFAKTKNAEALIKDVNNKIEKAKLKIKTEKQKLDLINKFE